jgi:hypothetical protein
MTMNNTKPLKLESKISFWTYFKETNGDGFDGLLVFIGLIIYGGLIPTHSESESFEGIGFLANLPGLIFWAIFGGGIGPIIRRFFKWVRYISFMRKAEQHAYNLLKNNRSISIWELAKTTGLSGVYARELEMNWGRWTA